jgi:hypothetical protein
MWMLLKWAPPDDTLHFMPMPVDTSASYADIPMDNHLLSINDITFVHKYIGSDDPETTSEHTDFFACIPVATGSNDTNMTAYHSKPVIIPLLQRLIYLQASDISPHFSFDMSYASLPGIPAPSFHSTSSLAQLNVITESMQSLLRQQQLFSNLLWESQQ